MPFHLIHDCAIGATSRPVFAPRSVAYFRHYTWRSTVGIYPTGPREKKNLVKTRPSSLASRSKRLARAEQSILSSAKRKSRLQLFLYPSASVPSSLASCYSSTHYTRHFSTDSNDYTSDKEGTYNVTRNELRSLVDEPLAAASDEEPDHRPVYRSGFWKDGVEPAQSEPLERLTESQIPDIQRATRALDLALRQKDTSHRDLWDIYQIFPAPRARFLPPNILWQLLSQLQEVEYKSVPGMLRFLALISDMKASGLDIPLHAWNSAISFAGRCLKKITANEVESALRIWREMEDTAKVSSNHVTFNILFDVATKARKFALAEMILGEMSTRKLEYNRYFRTGLIYYYGLRADGNKVRQAYSELINAGEVVDTAVINCIVGALINCGEAAAADLIFERAKKLHASKIDPQLPPSHWRQKRRLGRELNDAAKALRDANEQDEQDTAATSDASKRAAQVQEKTSVAPDLTTYKLLIKHHAIVLGDIDRAAELVDEMEEYAIGMHGSVFSYIFRAFAVHGGVLYTQWTRSRLENTWLAFVSALDAQAQDEESASEVSPETDAGFDAPDSPFFDTNQSIQRQSARESQDNTPFSTLQDQSSFTDTSFNHLQSSKTHYDTSTFEDTVTGDLIPAKDLEDPNRLLEAQEDESSLPPDDASFASRRTESDRVIYIGRAMAELVGRAFAKCTNIGRTAEVWAEVRERWTPEVLDDVAVVEAEIAGLFPGHEQLFGQIVEQELQRSKRR